LVAPLIGSLSAVIVWLHKRLEKLEEAQSVQRISLYGAENDDLNEGLTTEVKEVQLKLEELRLHLDELETELEEQKD
jgi:hypothetical protein